eukprot:CAMPEP_0113845614 /NCGR_PEP_ID=MMETSP0372-20130328/856_1 /TAXON_ID=340204 /ORGANISM="Lankesteria abbotti" /LENGTH=282 /DNA_ID=CAMNT_0000814679 /DNA_START=1 /DNA_END=849 /DNA_ORIENTATION=- /assembly_acc=CAM_ASM_000359
MLFSIEVSPRGLLLTHNKISDDNWSMIHKIAAESETTVLVTVGGAGRTAGFAGAIGDADTRKTLVSNIGQYASDHHLDGVDFDVVIPAETDKQDELGLFFKEMKNDLQSRSMIMTLAVHPAPRHRIPQVIIDQANFIHLMAYDNWCAFPPTARPPCHHSEYSYAKDVITQFLPLPHVHPEKTTLGIPFYGREVSSGQAKSYSDLALAFPDAVVESDEVDGYSFNRVQTVKDKVGLAFRYRLGGVMLWEVGQDLPVTHKDALLPAIQHSVVEHVKRLQHEEEL